MYGARVVTSEEIKNKLEALDLNQQAHIEGFKVRRETAMIWIVSGRRFGLTNATNLIHEGRMPGNT